MADVMMACGHNANSLDQDGKPCCVICFPDPLAMQVVPDPELNGRMAHCTYFKTCNSEKPSKVSLAFFNYKGSGSYYATHHCRICHYDRGAHQGHVSIFEGHVHKIIDHKFEPIGPAEFDEYYCGCHGWD